VRRVLGLRAEVGPEPDELALAPATDALTSGDTSNRKRTRADSRFGLGWTIVNR
jgi:hypothetical protein